MIARDWCASAHSPNAAEESPTAAPLTWKLSDIFPDDGAFAEAKQRLEKRLPEVDRFAGRLGDSAAVLLEALDLCALLRQEFYRLHAYASMRFDEDTRVAQRQGARQEVELLGTQFSARLAFVRPELLALPAGRVEAFLTELPALAPHSHFLKDLVRQREHVLEPTAERVVAAAGLLVGGPSALFGVLHNVEIPRPEVTLQGGETVRLTPAAFSRHRASCGRADRGRLFEAYFGAYSGFAQTLGVNLFEAVKGHLFRARARGYPSCLVAALDGDNVPESVYRNLLARVRENLPLLHRYLRLRASALGVDRLELHDLYGPIVSEQRLSYSPETAAGLLREAAAPLGGNYVAALERAFGERWIDWHPSPGKRAGAYASGVVYDVHPFVLLNYNRDYESLTTLAHEMGHALHSLLSNRAQPFPTATYPIFLAEIASTFSEALLSDLLLRDAASREERIFLLAHWLDGMRATLFRQAQFAEFELLIHEAAERGEALTSESLSSSYLALVREYHGHAAGVVHVDDAYAIEWATIPHFYYDFYVYQYATGIVAATSFAEALRRDPEGTRSRYLTLLSAGGSDYPLALLRQAGVDLESDGPYASTFRVMERKIDELEGLLRS